MRLSELPGIGEAIETKLSKLGITEVSQLLTYSPSRLSSLTNIDPDGISKLFEKARNKFEKEGLIKESFISGIELALRQGNRPKLSSGNEHIDRLFGGGLEYGETTEVYGEFGCGKTQFCHQMIVRSILDNPEKAAVWIDTESTFIPDRILQIACHVPTEALPEGIESGEELGKEVLSRTRVYPVINSIDQMLAMEKVAGSNLDKIAMIVIDSTTGLFRADYNGRGTLSERQRVLGDFLNLATKVTSIANCVTIMTNQVMQSPGIMFGDPTLAVGGTKLAHTSTHRVYFMKAGKKRIGKMVDSPRYPQIEVPFGLGEEGLVDIDTFEAREKARKAAKRK